MRRWRWWPAASAGRLAMMGVLALSACGGGGEGGIDFVPTTVGFPYDCGTACAQDALSILDVERVLAQVVTAAQERGQNATVAVTDRVGNVLAVYAMSGATATFRIDSGRGVFGGLEQVDILPSTFAAISKALTGAYLSSAGNAFTTRTASQIIQQHFNPTESNQPSGPLSGVQFSQLSCSDLMRRDVDASLGPKRSPLGLSADAGGLPLYKNGRLVGGVGVIADAVYGLDLNTADTDVDLDEILAVAGTLGFEAPAAIRANRITADGRSFRFADAPITGTSAASLAGLPGQLVQVDGYFASAGGIRPGTAYGLASSGIRRDTGAFGAVSGFVLVDALDNNLYPVRAGTDGGLTAAESQQILSSALDVSLRARAQIRQPGGQPAQVTISLVDTNGNVTGLVRGPDAPVFGIDVSLQKARTAAFLSNPLAGAELLALPGASSPVPGPTASVGPYVAAMRSFVENPTALSDGMAYSMRAVGNLARPFFPDGISRNGPGPLARPINQWSPFTNGMQLDLSLNAIVQSAVAPVGAAVGCTGLARMKNGMQIFAGGMPIYRTVAGVPKLLGAIGVSGDGTDQDDMIAFLGVANAAAALGTGVGHPPAHMRADVMNFTGGKLRYVQCPVTPFNNRSEQDVCNGL